MRWKNKGTNHNGWLQGENVTSAKGTLREFRAIKRGKTLVNLDCPLWVVRNVSPYALTLGP